MTFDSEKDYPSEETLQEKEIPPKKRIYTIVGLFLIAVIVLGAVFTIFASGKLGTWRQSISITHSPITKAQAGEKVEIRAKVSGSPKNVTLSYIVNPNNLTMTPYRYLTWSNAYMLLVGAGGEEYSYTIPANEVIGDVYYYIMATGEYGAGQAEPIRRISVADFYIEVPEKEFVVYVSKPASAKVTIKSLNDFEREVSLRTIDLPGGLIAEFNPSKVTPVGGVAESTLTIRIATDQYVPGGKYIVSVQGRTITQYLGTTVSITRESEEFILKVPSFDFEISPTSREVKKSELVSTTKEHIVSYNIDLSLRNEFQGNLTFKVAGLPSEGADYRIILTDRMFLVSGTTNIDLQIILDSTISSGTYTLTVSAIGEGYKREKLVTLTIKGATY